MSEKPLNDYRSLPTETPEELLERELHCDDPSVALLVLEELSHRSEAPAPPWEDFCTNYLPTAEKTAKRIAFPRRFAATAAAACLACALVTHAGGLDILRTMISWDEESLTVTTPAASAGMPHDAAAGMPHDAAAAASAPAAGASEFPMGERVSCASVEEGLRVLGSSERAPTAIPAGFAFAAAEVEFLGNMALLRAAYTNESGEMLQLNYYRYVTESLFSSTVAKDGGEVEMLEAGSRTHYLFSNNAYETAVWTPDEYSECIFSGPVSRAEMKALVLSAYP